MDHWRPHKEIGELQFGLWKSRQQMVTNIQVQPRKLVANSNKYNFSYCSMFLLHRMGKAMTISHQGNIFKKFENQERFLFIIRTVIFVQVFEFSWPSPFKRWRTYKGDRLVWMIIQYVTRHECKKTNCEG